MNVCAWGLILGLVFSLVLKSVMGFIAGLFLAGLYGAVLWPTLIVKDEHFTEFCSRIIFSAMFGLSFWLDKDLIKIDTVESFKFSIVNVAKQEVDRELKIGLSYTALIGVVDAIQSSFRYRLFTWLIVGVVYLSTLPAS